MQSDRKYQHRTARRHFGATSQAGAKNSVQVHRHSDTSISLHKESIEALEQSYSTLSRSTTFSASDILSGDTQDTLSSSIQCSSRVNYPLSPNGYLVDSGYETANYKSSTSNGIDEQLQTCRVSLPRYQLSEEGEVEDDWTFVDNVTDMNLESGSQSQRFPSSSGTLSRRTGNKAELCFDENGSAALKDFMADPSHKFWTWSQDEELWYHEDPKTGNKIWCPKELD
ncbi:hypothetical protein CSIM01_07249 [Colletotrichum simmondsii]|uniref:Uncharacterized protein n=1 Tax=Colletotrichum simmondsii TaxID=703756 RepID=A0A135RQQ0_9PEZI|nr:hypothetical protein CSIM01_07249 [Colletotrichum simmondsii]